MHMLDRIAHVLRGNQDAIEFFMIIHAILHFWDDLIDKDAALDDTVINAAMWSALIDLPNNTFYRKHQTVLNAVLVNAIANWQAANQFERGGNLRQLQIAFIARSDYTNILLQCAYLVGGKNWLLEITPMVRDQWTTEDFGAYLENLSRERSGRTGKVDSALVSAWYEQETDEYIKHGLSVFNAAMLGDTEAKHVARIAELIDSSGTVLVDMGCGIGGVGRLLKEANPALSVYGVTNVHRQIELCNELGGVTPVFCDYHETDLPPGSADVVLFNESFGYGDLRALLRESMRLLKPGGVLLIRDWFMQTDATFDPHWQYRYHTQRDVIEYAKHVGLALTEATPLAADESRYTQFIQSSEMMRTRYGAVGASPVWVAPHCALRFVKE
jgi:SAM-dependent methyltransferase